MHEKSIGREKRDCLTTGVGFKQGLVVNNLILTKEVWPLPLASGRESLIL